MACLRNEHRGLRSGNTRLFYWVVGLKKQNDPKAPLGFCSHGAPGPPQQQADPWPASDLLAVSSFQGWLGPVLPGASCVQPPQGDSTHHVWQASPGHTTADPPCSETGPRISMGVSGNVSHTHKILFWLFVPGIHSSAITGLGWLCWTANLNHGTKTTKRDVPARLMCSSPP